MGGRSVFSPARVFRIRSRRVMEFLAPPGRAYALASRYESGARLRWYTEAVPPHKPTQVRSGARSAGGTLVQLLQVRTLPPCLRLLWMLVMPLALLTSARTGTAADRPISLQIGGGERFFNQELGLNNTLGAGARM